MDGLGEDDGLVDGISDWDALVHTAGEGCVGLTGVALPAAAIATAHVHTAT